MRKPLSWSLERQIAALCARPAPYRIEALPLEHGAPDSYAALVEATGPRSPIPGAGAIRCERTGALIGERIPVWSGASERTIWSRPSANHLFRAWHDSHHILLCADFSRDGERRAAEYALSLVHGRAERAILWAETEGQQEYCARWGAFPDAQRDFVRDCIVHGIPRTVARGLYHREPGGQA